MTTTAERHELRPPGARYLAGRYALRDRLGAGGMGEVFRATDRLAAEDVALKRVTVPEMNLEFSMRPTEARTGDTDQVRLALAREFRLLASLRHPNIISVLDSGFDEQRMPYYTMTLLTGAESVVDAAHGRSRQEVLQLLVQLLQALAYLHRRRIVHRDLKPANILVRDGHLTVLDFGVAIAALEHHSPAGTLGYMAPEVLAGRMSTPAADLYAVGVIAYEMLTGRHPLEGVGTLLYRVLHRTPKVAACDPDPRIASLVGRLLSKDPRDRFIDAGELIGPFAEAAGIDLVGDSVMIRESYLQGAEFVGREEELEQLGAALDAAMEGAGSGWLVGGESGAGKSRLLEELRTRALVRGAVVLRGRARAEGAGPYHLWDDVLRSLCLFADVRDEEGAILRALVPDLEALLGRTLPDMPPLDPPTMGLRLAEVVTDLFRRLGRPAVLLLDDLQWAPESLTIIRHLEQVLHALPLLVVGAHREEDGSALRERLPGMRPMQLGRLGHEAIAQLGASMVGERFSSDSELIALLERETEGNVFFVVEVIRALADEAGGLDRIPSTTLPARILSGGMLEAVQRRLARVSEEDRAVLRVAAVAGRDLDLPVLQTASGVAALDPWLVRCADAMVLEVADARWRFSHDKVRDALVVELPDEARRALHREVAEALERVHGVSPATIPSLAYHWHAAREVEPAVRYLGMAADLALFQGVPREALTLGMDAVRLLGIELPRQPEYLALGIGNEMGLIHRYLAGRPATALLDVPELTDVRIANAVELLVRMQPAAHISQQLELFALITLKGLTLTLAHGNGPLAPLVYASYAALARGMTGDSRTAYEFSRLARELDARTGGRMAAAVAFLHGWFVSHWVSPLTESLPVSLAGMRAGLDDGRDVLYGCFNAAAYVIYLHASGAPLPAVIAAAGEQARRIDGRVSVAAFHCVHEMQVAKAFAGLTAELTSLTDAVYDESRDVASILRTGNHNQSGYYHVSKLVLHYHAGDYRAALAAADRALQLLAAFQGQVAEWQLVVHHALALLARAADVSAADVHATARAAMIETARAHAEKLRRWADDCEANFRHKSLLVDGELAWLDGQPDRARELLARAADAAMAAGFPQYAALSHERRAALERALRDAAAAKRARDDAMAAYAPWGAHAKVALLRQLPG